jgi:hypothetical protein
MIGVYTHEVNCASFYSYLALVPVCGSLNRTFSAAILVVVQKKYRRREKKSIGHTDDSGTQPTMWYQCGPVRYYRNKKQDICVPSKGRMNCITLLARNFGRNGKTKAAYTMVVVINE